MNRTRTVVDTGVAVSAILLPRSVPRQAFDAAALGKLLVSEATIAELDEVLRRPKFDKYVSEANRLEFLAALLEVAEVVEITETITICRDASDNRFLELAVSGGASHLLSGDDDLLALNPFRGVAVIKPQQFVLSFFAGDEDSATV